MKKLLAVFFMTLVMLSCGRKSEKDATAESKAFALEKENFFNSLKTPDEIVDRIKPGFMGFDSMMLSDPEQFYRHANSDIKAAANLGVYMADLNYCILYQQSESIKKYFEAAYELSKVIGIEKGILEFLMIRYHANIEKNDSVKLVVHQLFEQSTSGLRGTDRERLAGIAMTGYQIENLHLVLEALASFPDEVTEEQALTQKQLLQFMLEQRGKFEVIYNFVRANSDPLDPNQNPNYPFFDNALREIIGVYHNVTEEDPRINELKEKVDAVRNKIVNP
jgi:hypothetical protein